MEFVKKISDRITCKKREIEEVQKQSANKSREKSPSLSSLSPPPPWEEKSPPFHVNESFSILRTRDPSIYTFEDSLPPQFNMARSCATLSSSPRMAFPRYWPLIKNGLNAISKVDGMTPIHIASKHGQVNIIRLFLGLIKYGLDINKITKSGKHAITIACKRGNTQIIRLLVEVNTLLSLSYVGADALLLNCGENSTQKQM